MDKQEFEERQARLKAYDRQIKDIKIKIAGAGSESEKAELKGQLKRLSKERKVLAKQLDIETNNNFVKKTANFFGKFGADVKDAFKSGYGKKKDK